VCRQGLEAEVSELEDFVVQCECADEDANVRTGQVTRNLSAVLQRLPGDLQQLALLRVHMRGFAWADSEEGRVEVGHAVDVSAPAADQPARLGLVPAAERAHVVPVCRCIGDAVLTIDQIAPERPVVRGAARQSAAEADNGDLLRGYGVEGVPHCSFLGVRWIDRWLSSGGFHGEVQQRRAHLADRRDHNRIGHCDAGQAVGR